MCAPVALAAVGVGVAASSGGLQMYASYQQSKYQGKMNKNNAELAQQQANEVGLMGAHEASIVRMQGRQAMGSALAGVAASGIDTTSGSIPGALAGISVNTELDAATIKTNAAKQAWGLMNQAQDYRTQASMIQKASILGAIGGGLNTVGSSLGAASTGYDLGKKFQ